MKKLANIFKALSDETRLRILYLLLQQELCVCEIVDIMAESQPKISRHLAILKNSEIALDRREAQMIFYSINLENEYVGILKNALVQLLDMEVEEQLLERLKKVLSYRKEGKCCPNGSYPGGCC